MSVEEIRQVKDHDDRATKDGYLQKNYITKEGVKIYLKLTRADASVVEFNETIVAGKEAKVVLMIQTKNLGNWDDPG